MPATPPAATGSAERRNWPSRLSPSCDVRSEAERRLGTLFNASDYPSTLDGLFDLEVTYPAIEPPAYLVSLHPEVYQQEQARVRERFENAVELAEQAFATELQRLTAHLDERLTGLHDGQPKVFRDSAVQNLREFLERFRWLNIRSSPELDMLVKEAQQFITGIKPQQLRDSVRLRQMVARDFEQIQDRVGEMLVDRPRRVASCAESTQGHHEVDALRSRLSASRASSHVQPPPACIVPVAP